MQDQPQPFDGEVMTEDQTQSTVTLMDLQGPSGFGSSSQQGSATPLGASSLGAPSGVLGTNVATPQEAMRAEEIRRIRAFLMFTSFACIIVAFVIPLVDGDPLATWLMSSTSLVTALLAAGLYLYLRDETRYQPGQATAFALVAGVAVAAGYYFFGVTSAMVMLVPIGTYLLALGESFKGVLLCQINVQGSHLLISVLQLAGVLPEVSLINTVADDPMHQVGMLFATQGIFTATFIMARGVRQSTVATLDRLNDAITDNARRQALLFEAKQALALARNVGGPGRFSEQVFGEFELGNVLGRGAMGEVYEAHHLQTGQLAAMKLLHQEAMGRADSLARFLREVEIARSLQEENIVRVLAVSGPEELMPFFVMERLHGKTLSEYLQHRSKLNPKELTRLMVALADGVGAAHRAGIIHRDLKPSNIFHHRSGTKTTWKILDFGVSKFMDDGDTITAGAIVGTPAYMSPEQAKSERVTPQTDLYALGVIAYRVLTGRPAFTGKDLPMVLHSVVYSMPPMPSQVADLHQDYDCLLSIAMAKDPKDRFGSASELCEAFVEASNGTLSAALRDRGFAQMAAHPWGVQGLG